MSKVLIVEDEESLCELLQYNLKAEGYSTEVCMRGDDAEMLLKDSQPDLLLLDWMLPGLSGIELCRMLRQRDETNTLPIIMLTARGEESERIHGLEVGADDYVVKPFSVPELMVRIKSLLRRTKPKKVVSQLQSGTILLDRVVHRVTRSDREIRLGPIEFRLLEFLMQHKGSVYSRAQLLREVWGHFVDERTVDVHIARIRRVLTKGKERDPIRTVRGIGYSFEE